MTWKNILKAELTREGLIEYLRDFEPYVESSQFRMPESEVEFYHNIIENPEYTVDSLPQDKLNEFLNENSFYDNFFDEFEGELEDIDYSKMPSSPSARDMFPENTFRYGY